MIQPERLYHFLQEQGITFFTGVPDSLLKHFLKYINDNTAERDHIITANEGLAMALASGYYFSSGKTPLVYLQNSGLGNIINPLTSLADKEMYSVPLVLLIGWRGKPGVQDEPQHIKMGRITLPLLDVLEVPYYLLDADEQSSFQKIKDAVKKAVEEKRPVALIAPGEIFEEYPGIKSPDIYSLHREQVIQKIISSMKGDELAICTTGKTGREFYEQNLRAGKKIAKYLLSVGAMGHANHIALGVRIESSERIIMLDGDGALLMHMGSLPTLAHHAANHFVHIVINNGSHESVGGQPTEAFKIDCCAVARACGYKKTCCITTEDELDNWIKNDFSDAAVQFVEIKTSRVSRSDTGRPSGYPVEWKENFMSSLKKKN